MIQIAGPNGCGKTTFYNAFLRPAIESTGKRLVYINADDIALEMRSRGGTPLGLDEQLARRAQVEADDQRNQLLLAGHEESVIFETVFSDPDGYRLNFLRRAKVAGYKVVHIFIAVADVNLSAQRVSQRVAEGGHDVPMAKQVERFGRSLANGRAALEIADLSLFVDNSQPRINKAYSHKLVAVFLGSDPLEVISLPPQWFRTIHPGV